MKKRLSVQVSRRFSLRFTKVGEGFRCSGNIQFLNMLMILFTAAGRQPGESGDGLGSGVGVGGCGAGVTGKSLPVSAL